MKNLKTQLNSKMKLLISLLLLITSIVSCNTQSKILLNFKCKEKLPIRNKALHIVEFSKSNMTSILGHSLFDLQDYEIIRKEKFSKNNFLGLETFMNNTITDVKGVFFSNENVGALLRISNDVAPHSSCSKKTINVSPLFLQTIFEKSLAKAIEYNVSNFDSSSPIRNQNQFVRVLFQDRKFIDSLSGNWKHDNADESLALNFERINLFISYEMIKSLTFIIGHEICHFITKCELGKEFELDADALGILGYHFFSYKIYYDYNKLYECYFPSSASLSNLDSSVVVETMLGRNLYEIVNNIYSNTYFGNGNATHPSFEERLKHIKYLTDTLHPDELYKKLIIKNILTSNINEESIYEKIGNGSNLIYNASWLFGK